MDDLEKLDQSWPGRIALMLAHCAGMVGLVALPVWVGTLITYYGLDPQRAGGLATLFLLGAIAGSLVCASSFHRLRAEVVTPCGFALSAMAFLGIANSTDFALLAALHTLAGAAAGAALSMTHGTIGRSRNPQRMFALASLALGLFAIALPGLSPAMVASCGGPVLFRVFGAVMMAAAVSTLFAFAASAQPVAGPAASAAPIRPAVWYAAAGISCMSVVQAMMFGLLEQIGAIFAAVMILTHSFAFCLVVQLDPDGRALAAAPAMLMAGAAIGPVLGATLVESAGYGTLGGSAMVLAIAALACFAQAGRRRTAAALPPCPDNYNGVRT